MRSGPFHVPTSPHHPATEARRPADVAAPTAGPARGASRIQAFCRRRLADCVVVPLVDGASGRVDLRVGARRAAAGEQLWVRGLDARALDDAEAMDRLARFVRVWVEPAAGEGRG